jgi:4-alpha-glucanotransferase
MTTRPLLLRLADSCGLLRGYEDFRGVWRETGDEARVAVLAAMGIDAASEASSGRSLEWLAEQDDLAPLVLVWDLRERIVTSATTPRGGPAPGARCELLLQSEDRERHTVRACSSARPGAGLLEAAAGERLSPGYYDGILAYAGRERRCYVLASPGRCSEVEERLGTPRALGIALNVYTLRSAHNWGIGDWGDVRRLAEESTTLPVQWLGLSPMHASTNHGRGISPYSPTNRLYANEIYLDVAAVAELERSRDVSGTVSASGFRSELERCRAASVIDRSALVRLKRDALATIHAEFAENGTSAPTRRAYDEYVGREGEPLLRHASYEAIVEHHGAQGSADGDWRCWPTAFRQPTTSAIAEFRAAHERRVDFHRWIQFHCDIQRATASRGLGLGLMADLAVGTDPGGSEVWASQELFADGVEIGAPPDDYSERGQAWGIAPMLPRALRQTGYRHLRRLLEANMRHCGALRIDHAMGLVRQFWVTPGSDRTGGAYVTLPAEATFAVLAIESRRARTVIVGEDLGTVPAGFRERMARHGCLRTHVLYFERDDAGAYAPPDAYSRDSLATPNSHDQPPLRGYCSGVDLDRRAAAGELTTADHALARTERRADEAALIARLARDGGLDPSADGDLALCAAALTMLARSPAALVGVGLDDLGGEIDPVNVPGLAAEAGTLWSRKMRRDCLAILRDRGVLSLLKEAAFIMDATPDDG